MTSPTLATRFWSKVDKRGKNECWLWLAATNTHGYGQIADGNRRKDGKLRLATHVSLELNGTPLEPGKFALHSCDNTLCVNPNHLFSGNHLENMADMIAKGRQAFGLYQKQKTHCNNGHEFTIENTYVPKKGKTKRQCRKCKIERQRNSRCHW